MQEVEVWTPVIDYEGLYTISNLGRVKSIERYCSHWLGGKRLFKDKILTACVNNRGYYVVVLSKDNKRTMKTVHRLVWESFNGKTDLDVLHNIEGNKLDCRLSNLHIGTDRQNHTEYRLSTKKSSKYIGVSWHKATEKWGASIYINHKRRYLGSYNDEIKAHEAYQKALTLKK